MAFDCEPSLIEIDSFEIQKIGFILMSAGIITDDETPFTRVHFNECGAHLKKLFSPYLSVDTIGTYIRSYGNVYAIFDTGKFDNLTAIEFLEEKFKLQSNEEVF